MTTTSHHSLLRQRASAWCILICVALQLAAAPRVSADNENADDASYSRLIASALQEYDLAHWSESKTLFAQAHALRPSARTLRGLTQAAFALRDYVAAIEYATQAVSSTTNPLTDELRLQMLALLEDGRRLVARVQLLSAPKSASVLVDGSSALVGPDGRLTLNPGTHRLHVQAPELGTTTRILQVESGEIYALDLRHDPEARRGSQPESDAPWMLIGVSGAVAAAGAVLVALAASDIAKVEQAEVGSRWSVVQNANARAPVFSGVGFALLGAGVAGAATGIVWKVSRSSGEREARSTFSVMPGLGSVRIAGSF